MPLLMFHFRYVSRVSINGKDVLNASNAAGTNDYRTSTTPHNPIGQRYHSSSWKTNSGASSGASTGASPVHSSNEDQNGDGG